MRPPSSVPGLRVVLRSRGGRSWGLWAGEMAVALRLLRPAVRRGPKQTRSLVLQLLERPWPLLWFLRRAGPWGQPWVGNGHI